jgi:hypothetical protein
VEAPDDLDWLEAVPAPAFESVTTPVGDAHLQFEPEALPSLQWTTEGRVGLRPRVGGVDLAAKRS